METPIKSHKGLKDAESFAKSCCMKNCSEKFYKFRRKESLMKSFLSYVVGCNFTIKELRDSLTVNPIQERTFRVGGFQGWGVQKCPALNLSHISYNDETLHSYTLAKEDPKNM